MDQIKTLKKIRGKKTAENCSFSIKENHVSESPHPSTNDATSRGRSWSNHTVLQKVMACPVSRRKGVEMSKPRRSMKPWKSAWHHGSPHIPSGKLT